MVSSKYFIDSAAQRSFDKDGVVLIPSFINMSTVQRMRLAVDRALVHSANYFDRVRIWEDDPDCAWYCLESAAPALAAELLKTSKVNLFFDQVFTKEPGAPATPWHNDQPFWPVRGWPVITIWLGSRRDNRRFWISRIHSGLTPMESLVSAIRGWTGWFI